MRERGFTRRSLLAGMAGAVAGGLVRPHGVLAALAGVAEPTLSEHPVGELPASGLTLRLERNVDLIGVEWSGPPDVRIQLRSRSHAGHWGGWVSAAGHGHGPDGPRSGRLVGDPVWTGGTTIVQLRSSRALGGVRLHLVDVSGGMGAHRSAIAAAPLAGIATLPQAPSLLQAGPGQPPILARRAWAQGMAHPRVAPGYGAVRMAFVHHTDNPNGYSSGEVPAMLRAIFIFHRDVNGWNDIGYNFAIDSFGRIFEARAGGIDEPVVGAHAGGYNLYSTGVAILGTYVAQRISPAARQALTRLLAWKLSLHGVPVSGRVTVPVSSGGALHSRFPVGASVSLPRVAGHRDADSTDCPGDALYRELASLRHSAHGLAGRSARATLLLQAAGERSSPTAALAGGVAFLDGTPIAGAPIEIQARGVTRKGEVVQERTIAVLVSGAGGAFSLPANVSTEGAMGGTSLRALCPGARGIPATVSEPVHVAGGVSFTVPAGLPPRAL